MADADIIIRSRSSSRRSWMTASFREPSDVFRRDVQEGDDEENLKWAALEKLPTYDRMRKGILRRIMEEDGGKVSSSEVELHKLGVQERKILLDHIFEIVEQDNERFLLRLRDRIDRVGLELPKIEVRYENLSIEADVYVGSRALPTLWNTYVNVVEGFIGRFSPSKKKTIKILDDVSGILKPSRTTLLLGPPAAGKTTLMLALAGKADKNLRVSGRVTYCGHELTEFYPERTSAYISQYDLHNGEMTVRETIDFSARCLGVGTRYEMLSELSRRERVPASTGPEIDAFMKVTAMQGQRTSVATDYILKVLGLDICADIIVGDEMRRGISGGQKKRVTTGEMLAGPARALFMDEISTGLDSSTTFQIVKFIKQMVRVMDGTVLVSLLQPAPETYNLFDDIILLSEGQVVYHGPREHVLEFFESAGFKCPERKGVADFLQEVTSKKDQEQYWVNRSQPYRHISVREFAQYFKSFHVGLQLAGELEIPYDKSKTHPAALVTEKYGIPTKELLKAVLARGWLLMKRNSFVYIFKTVQITILSLIVMTVFFRTEMHHTSIADGSKYFGALFFSLIIIMFNGFAELSMTVSNLPVFYKQRDSLFFPPWVYGIQYWILRIPLSLLDTTIWMVLTYYVIGFAPSASRFFRLYLALFMVHQMALSLFRFIGAIGRSMVVANTIGTFSLLLVFVLGGFVISKGTYLYLYADDIKPWWIWGFWSSPMMYGQNAISNNEFLDKRWSAPNNDSTIDAPTIGTAFLRSRGLFINGYWYWLSVGALLAYSILFNILFILAITYLDPIASSQNIIAEDDAEDKEMTSNAEQRSEIAESSRASTTNAISGADAAGGTARLREEWFCHSSRFRLLSTT
uniref:ABC transporter domain-containing protein n=1 Tax=Ananas comosus var. bracteatus TaxID=296719 RepID=A0A6V7NHL9_ANACO|nr:unnamed protein product [Ananas comosus var. bracteatus]